MKNGLDAADPGAPDPDPAFDPPPPPPDPPDPGDPPSVDDPGELTPIHKSWPPPFVTMTGGQDCPEGQAVAEGLVRIP